MKKLLSITLMTVLLAVIVTNCKKDKKGDPPALPPQESMTIDFSNFTTDSKSADLVFDQKGTNDSHWATAATIAGYWRLIIAVNLVVPVTAFKLAIDQNPVYVSEKTWQWSYNVTVSNTTYKAKLVGQIRSTDVLWNMYITVGSSEEVLWFTGTSLLDGTGGQWILNESLQSSVALLQIDWTKTGTSVGTVKYTYVKTGNNFKDSYIEYGLTANTLNAYYTIHYYNGVKFSDVNVEWSTTAYNGRIKSSDYLEGTWFCWNANKINCTCP